MMRSYIKLILAALLFAALSSAQAFSLALAALGLAAWIARAGNLHYADAVKRGRKR